jgi:hypothetical protein
MHNKDGPEIYFFAKIKHCEPSYEKPTPNPSNVKSFSDISTPPCHYSSVQYTGGAVLISNIQCEPVVRLLILVYAGLSTSAGCYFITYILSLWQHLRNGVSVA